MALNEQRYLTPSTDPDAMYQFLAMAKVAGWEGSQRFKIVTNSLEADHARGGMAQIGARRRDPRLLESIEQGRGHRGVEIGESFHDSMLSPGWPYPAIGGPT